MYSRLPGPYAPAVLRFHISFPPSYPALPPLVTFSTDVFHPLLTPLTTFTHTTATSDADTVSATDEERLPPGGFSESAMQSPASTIAPVRSVAEDTTSSSPGVQTSATGVSIVTILEYIRSTFSEEAVLDSVSLDAAANPGAYHAWRAYRGSVLPAQQPLSPTSTTSSEGVALGRNRRPAEWNWDGVWEDRVKRAVSASLAEPVLYGPAAGEDIVSRC